MKISMFKVNKKGLSPIFATLILVAIVIVFGATAYLYATNVTSATTNQLTGEMGTNQQSISERIGFQSAYFIQSDSSNPSFSPNPSPTLTVYVINSGTVSLQITGALLHIYDNHELVSTKAANITTAIRSAVPTPDANLKYLNGASEVQTLNPGQEGYFVLKLAPGTSLSYGSYSIQIITSSGSSFEYAP